MQLMSFVLFTLSTMNCRLNHLENLLSHGTAAPSHLDGLCRSLGALSTYVGMCLFPNVRDRKCLQTFSETLSYLY